MKFLFQPALGIIAFCLGVATLPAHAQLRVTEVAPWASGNSPYASDWFEVTNVGAAAQAIAGWRMDDNSASFTSAVALTGIASIAPGQSVIFIESAAANAGFLATWFGSGVPAGLLIGNYIGAGVGLSTGGDAVNLYDAGGALRAGISFGAADATSPFQSFDNGAGLDGVTLSQLSVAGRNGAFVAFNDAGEIGSPGLRGAAIAPVPEPETYALMLAGLAVLGGVARRRRPRSRGVIAARFLVAAAIAAVGVSAQAADSIQLGTYQVTGTYLLDSVAGARAVSGLEASAVTYARDRGSLFYVGDEGTGVIEVSRTGQTLGSMAFSFAGTASTNHDTEGLTYLGVGRLVVTEERLVDAYRFDYAANGTATLADSYVSISNAVVGNNGLEGISVDPRDGSFLTIKQQSPQEVLAGTLSFAGGVGGVSTMAPLFNPALLGLSTLSDVQTLSPIDALAGTGAADNFLVLSLGSRRLVEVNRQGHVLSSFDLANVLPHNAIEGVTVDELGNIYLVAEQVQDGSNLPGGPPQLSQLIVLSQVTAPVPEPETYALMLAGIGALGFVARRRRNERRR